MSFISYRACWVSWPLFSSMTLLTSSRSSSATSGRIANSCNAATIMDVVVKMVTAMSSNWTSGKTSSGWFLQAPRVNHTRKTTMTF